MKKKLSSIISRISSYPKYPWFFLAALALVTFGIFALRIFVLKDFAYPENNSSYEAYADDKKEADSSQDLNNGQMSIATSFIDYELLNKIAVDAANSVDLIDPKSEAEEILLRARQLYWDGVWDGSPTTIREHDVSIGGDKGFILLDGDPQGLYIDTGDVPEHYRKLVISGPQGAYGSRASNIVFIPDKGSYMIIDGALTRFVKRSKVDLRGDILEFSEFDTDKVSPYYFELKYDSFGDVLYLVVYVKTNDISQDNLHETEGGDGSFWYVSDKEVEAEMGMYLYKFPDYNVSRVEFVDKIIACDIDNYGMRYIDTNHVLWEYFENQEEYEISTEFVKTDQTSLWMIPPRSKLIYSDSETAKRIYKDYDKGIFSVEINGKTIGNMGKELVWYHYVNNSGSFEFMLANCPGVIFVSNVNSKDYKKAVVGTCDYVLDYECGWLFIR